MWLHNEAVDESLDRLSKALADPVRRRRLAGLSADNGRIDKRLNVPRQAVTVAMRLIGPESGGAGRTDLVWREECHILNSVPIHQIAERWIRDPRAGASALAGRTQVKTRRSIRWLSRC